MCWTTATSCAIVINGVTNMKLKNITTTQVAGFALGALIVVLILRYGFVAPIMNEEIMKKLRLQPGTQLWDIWTDIPIPIFTKFYFWNVTNPYHVVNGDKPVLRECGPYTYQEKRLKVILKDGEEEVSYRPRTTWFFRPELSHGAETDKITLLNIPFVGVSKMAWEMTKQPFILSTLDDMLTEKGEKVFQTNMVKDFLFDGIPIENYMELLSLPVTEAFGSDVKISERLLDGDFGFFDDRNGTADEVWVVKTGKNNLADFGKIVSWKGETKMDVWKDDECDQIRGTDGSIFPPFADKNRILTVFVPDMCRHLNLEYSKNSHYQGVSTMKFTPTPDTFGSMKDYPQNKCYCNGSYEHCMKGGLIPVGPCQQGAPLYISKPHFVDAHADYQNSVIGLDSGSKDYESFIELDENLGEVVRATFRLQMNLELQSYDSMPAFANVPNLMFPLIWIEQTASLTDDLMLPVKILSYTLRILSGLTTFAIGICLITLTAAVLWEVKKGGQGKLNVKSFC